MTNNPACEVVEETGELTRDPPWPCPYTHRVHIHLRGLSTDIRNAAAVYSKDIGKDEELRANFEACMRQLYPT